MADTSGGSNADVRVLLVEDDPEVAGAVVSALSSKGFRVTHAPTVAAAQTECDRGGWSVIVLDLTLPDGNGLDFAGRLRAAENATPILMLTARDSVPERLAGFERGADDYLGKPFDLDELAARILVIARRSRGGDRHLLHYGDVQLDLLTRKVRRPNLEETLSDREAELLAFLMRHPEEALSRERILEQVWGDEIDDDSNILNVYVNLLRNKMETPKHVQVIRTVRGLGYMLSSKAPSGS
jgi:DNA-binding response OmpR family regulator